MVDFTFEFEVQDYCFFTSLFYLILILIAIEIKRFLSLDLKIKLNFEIKLKGIDAHYNADNRYGVQ